MSSTLCRRTGPVVLAWLAAVSAIADTGPEAGEADTPVGPASQVTLQARLSVAGMQEILRRQAIATVSTEPVVDKPRRDAGVGADVRSQLKPESLSLIARSNGQLDVKIPIHVTVTPVMPGVTDAGVDYKGCKPTIFNVTMPLVPRFSGAGSLQFAAGKVTVDNGRYSCRIYTNLAGDAYGAIKNLGKTIDGIFSGRGVEKLADVDVARLIRQTITRRGRAALAGRIKQVNARLPTEKGLLALLRSPATFGSVISLGIDQPRVRLRAVTVAGDNYDLLGSLEGHPRLRFGADWAEPADLTSASDLGDGFRLPARLLFPTDRCLRPDATSAEASSCLGAFRLQPVARREDLAVLQRCDVDDHRNVIWLSGDDAPPPDSAISFERPMSNVLGEIVAWLEDPDLWRGVEGVERLRAEVAAFRDLVERFQADTTLPIPGRGELAFSGLGLDLHRLWVTDEAIQADVTLVGNANLRIDLMP